MHQKTGILLIALLLSAIAGCTAIPGQGTNPGGTPGPEAPLPDPDDPGDSEDDPDSDPPAPEPPTLPPDSPLFDHCPPICRPPAPEPPALPDPPDYEDPPCHPHCPKAATADPEVTSLGASPDDGEVADEDGWSDSWEG